ncbi:hypothetical protein PHYPSEUDO_008573 [Phytophthora pseudosyringae]|uniref:Uncharacterized protein n=1 Tax=Phytophthora pseudosyringae TaxID=221518 RepID=A0A8T1VGY4_9STRA|nr:hypothetical protein PHYPSEUDO_008573 [Phytophthora pseudosyringae]
MDRLLPELAALPGLEQLSASQLRDLPWRVRELTLIALFREQVSSSAVAEELQSRSRDRKMERKADKLLDDVDRAAVRRKEESYRADFMLVAAAELARLGAPALITWQKLVFDKECCAQAFRLLLTRIKSTRRSAASGVSTNSSSLLAARYAAASSRQGGRVRRESDNNAQDDDELRDNEIDTKEQYIESEGRTRFPALKSTTQGPLRHPSTTRKKGISLASQSTSGNKSSGLNWNFDTTVGTPSEEDEFDGSSTHGSSEKIAQIGGTPSHQKGAGISIERTLPSKQPAYFASKFKRTQLQAVQEENAALTAENGKLRDEIKQLEALNGVLQSDNSNNSMDDNADSVEFAQRRIRLVQAQNLQLQRKISLLEDAMQAHENAEVNLMSALNHWRSVIEAGREEAKAAGADQNATDARTEPEETGARQRIRWMLAVPDKLMNELKRVEAQIRGAATAANACFETKLRVSKLSSSFLRNDSTSLKMSEIYGREPSSLAHLRVERVTQLENALGSVSAELDQLSAQVLQRLPPKASTTDPMRSSAYELGKSVRELLFEVGAFGVVVPTSSASATRNAATPTDDAGITAVDIIKALSSTAGMARGPGGAKEREKQAKVMLKHLHARHTATENNLVACRREAEYWRAAWHTQGEILGRLAKRVRHLGQKKMEWCQHYLLTPMMNLSEVFTSFQQAYDENTTRQNPYLPLLVETLRMEHPMLEDALQQWQDYSRSVQLKMDELVADYEANRLVFVSSSGRRTSRPATPVSELGDDTLPSMGQQVPVH